MVENILKYRTNMSLSIYRVHPINIQDEEQREQEQYLKQQEQ